jgi:hypothetical protein
VGARETLQRLTHRQYDFPEVIARHRPMRLGRLLERKDAIDRRLFQCHDHTIAALRSAAPAVQLNSKVAEWRRAKPCSV